jgi:hypothetical protein
MRPLQVYSIPEVRPFVGSPAQLARSTDGLVRNKNGPIARSDDGLENAADFGLAVAPTAVGEGICVGRCA